MRNFLKLLLLILLLSIVVTACGGLELPYQVPTETPVVTILPAEIAVLNLKTAITQDGSIQTTAELSISPIGKGTLEVIAPSKMLLGETRTIKLTITPENILLGVGTPTPNATPQTAIQQLVATKQAIEMYPVMIAELQGLHFQILPDTATQKIVTSDSIVEWLWAITPLATDKQVLLLSLSTPVAVGANREIFGTMEITNLSIEITVQPNGNATFTPIESPTAIFSPTATIPPTATATATQVSNLERANEQIIQNLGLIIVAIITLLGTAITAYVSYLNNKANKEEKGDKTNSGKKRKKAG